MNSAQTPFEWSLCVCELSLELALYSYLAIIDACFCIYLCPLLNIDTIYISPLLVS